MVRGWYFAGVLLLLALSFSGCSGPGSGTKPIYDGAAVWDQFEELMTYEVPWDFQEEADVEELKVFFDGIFSYYAGEFTIIYQKIQEVIELEPASFGDIHYRTRTFTQGQIADALDVAAEDGWEAVDNLDSLDTALLQQMLLFHARDEQDWLNYLKEETDDPDFVAVEGYPKAEEPMLSIDGSKAELVLEWVMEGLLLYEGDLLMLHGSVLASLQWQYSHNTWLVTELNIAESTAFRVPQGYWLP